MPYHEFGILMENQIKASYNYNPSEYQCISVEDDIVMPLVTSFKTLKTFHHSFNQPNLGLAYYGITLIPYDSLGEFQNVLISHKKFAKNPEMINLIGLVTMALKNHNGIIHFGI